MHAVNRVLYHTIFLVMDNPLHEYLWHYSHCRFAQDLQKEVTTNGQIHVRPQEANDHRRMTRNEVLQATGNGRVQNIIDVTDAEAPIRRVCYS